LAAEAQHYKNNFMKTSVCVLAALLLLCSCDKEKPSTTGINSTDDEFVSKASVANRAEIGAGQTASAKADDEDVRAFGTFMVTDHTNSQMQLKGLADSLNLRAPDSLDAEHVALKMQLDSLTGRAFDSVYIHSQVKDHHDAIDLFQKEIDKGKNSRLIDFATSQMPHLQMHLQMADSLAQKF